MVKKIIVSFLALLFCLMFTACDALEEFFYDTESQIEYMQMDSDGHFGDKNQTWAIYWYLCGSDLESDGASATADLEEMMEVKLPENVKVIIETGGAYEWQNEIVDSDYLERYVYSSDGLECIEQLPLDNMGDPQTLADFLYFCKENYPADRTMALFWNHGGGSVSGVSFDEVFDYDSLTLGELYQAFDAVYQLSSDNPPFDVVGFDTCLMASVDTAYIFEDIAEYMVASEETEPSIGWFYSGWLQALADAPGMDGAWLGKEICDSYIEDCVAYGLEDETTLSVVDLSKIQPLVKAYDAMGAEALVYAVNDPYFISDFGREAEQSENYGGNTRQQGYSNMVDLGHLAANCSDVLPKKSKNVLNKLKDCLVYKVNGPYCNQSTGLSCYYSYNGDMDDLSGFQIEGCSESFKYFFDYSLKGKLSKSGMEYLNSIGFTDEEAPDVPTLKEYEDVEIPLYLDDDAVVVMELDKEIKNILQSVHFQLAYSSGEDDSMFLLGTNNDLIFDWENGVFKSDYQGTWYAIDGYPVYMEISYEDEFYTLYSIPILLNGENYNLHVVYDKNDEAFHILGARKGVDENGMSDKQLVKLKPGDKITTLHYISSIEDEDDEYFYENEIDTFTVTENTTFEEVDMGDGIFYMMFELTDAQNNTAYSQLIQFIVDGENIEVEIIE